MDSINGFPLPPRSTGRVEDIEKGFTSLAVEVWNLVALPRLTDSWKKRTPWGGGLYLEMEALPPSHLFYFELGACLFLSLPPVSISCQVCSLPRYSHSNCNCVTNNKQQYQFVHQWFKCSAQKRFKDLWRHKFPNRSMGSIFKIIIK